MKHILFYTFVYCMACSPAMAQDVTFKTKFFSLRDPRFSIGAGAELGGVFRHMSNTGTVTDNSPKYKFLYGGTIDFDIYSPHSKLGLYFPLGLSVGKMRFNGATNYNDISLSNLEVP